MTKPEKDLSLLFVFFTTCCVLAADLTQTRYKAAVVLCALVWSYFVWQLHFKKSWQRFGLQDERLFLVLLLAAGSLVRVMVAIAGYGNYDSVSWEIVGSIVEKGGNVFNETTRYNTSPIWFWILGGIKKLAMWGSWLSYRAWVRLFLSLVDVCTVLVLWRIAPRWGVSRIAAAAFFFLNPVSILLSSYHAQFENLAVLCWVIGLGFYAAENRSPVARKRLLWALVTLGVAVKHNICYALPITLRFAYGHLRHWLLLFLVSCVVFFAFFAPYWQISHTAIIRNVFLYGSYPMMYGISTFIQGSYLKFIFVAALFLYAFVQRSQDLPTRCLQGMLFFLCFTPGFGHQYLALPIALGALRPSGPFFVFTGIAALAIMGSDRNIDIRALSWVPLNAVWLCVLAWFGFSHKNFSLHRGEPKV